MDAVGRVTLNRWRRALQVKPDATVCDVVYAGARRGHHHFYRPARQTEVAMFVDGR